MLDRVLKGDVTLADLQYGDDPGLESAEYVRNDDGTDEEDKDDDGVVGFVADELRSVLHREGVQTRVPTAFDRAVRKGELACQQARVADPYVDPKTGKLKEIFSGNGKGGDGGLSPDELSELDETFGIADSVNGAANAAVDGGAEKLKVAYFRIKDGEFKGEQVQIYFFRDLGGHWDIEFEGGRLEEGKLVGGQMRMVFMEGRIAGRSIYVSPKDLEPLSEFAAGELDKHLRPVIKKKDKLRVQREAVEAKAKETVANVSGSKRGGKRVAGQGKRAKKDELLFSGLN